VAAWFIHFIYSGIYTSGGLVYTVEYLPVAAWYINSGISASGGLVYTQRNISQRRLGLCIVEYLPVTAWFIQLNICQWRLGLYNGIYASGGLVYKSNICQWRLGLHTVYLTMAALFIHNGTYARGGLVYTQWNICQWRLGLYIVEYLTVAS
jgi:hypothetical protein